MKQIFALILLLFVSVALKAQERYKEYYDDGKLKTAGYINKNTGERQGHWVTYRQDGTKFEEFDYKNGEKEGKYYVYDNKGRIYIMETYHNGMLHGTMLQYYNEPDRKGQLPLYARTTYQNGMPVGTKYTYDRNGAIIKKRTFSNGIMATENQYEGNTIYKTSRKNNTDTDNSDDKYYYETIETTRQTHNYAHRNTNHTTAQRQKIAKSKRNSMATNHTKKPKTAKQKNTQTIPSFIKIENTPKPAKKGKLKVGKDGVITVE